MNATSTRKLAEQQMTRRRVRERIALAAARAADTCNCPLCEARRSGDPAAIFAAILRARDGAEPATHAGEPRH